MATIFFSGTFNADTKVLQFIYDPPANVSGKLCRLYASQVWLTDGTDADSRAYAVLASLPQPYGRRFIATITKTVDTTKVTTAGDSKLNDVIAIAQQGLVTTNDNPVFVQLDDGPQLIKVSLLSAEKWEDIVLADAGELRLAMILHFVPANQKNHHEELESYSTGINVRV